MQRRWLDEIRAEGKGEFMIAHILEWSGITIGGCGLLAQTIPMVPDDFKSWPITAICGFIAIVAMVLRSYDTRITTKAMEKMGDRLGDVMTGIAISSEQNNEKTRRMDETNSKLGALVTQMATTNERMATTNERLAGVETELKQLPDLIYPKTKGT